MKRCLFLCIVFLFFAAVLFPSCKPINIFSPFVNPSNMGNDAKMDAGYNAIANGDYEEAVDYFTDVINGSSGKKQADAYIGRAAAYMNLASPSIDTVVGDLLSGELNVDSPSDVIQQVVQNGEYDTFFENVQNAASDYNAAVDNLGTDVDPGILLEAYEANMMAATGVGAQKIALVYNTSPWGPADVSLNDEYAAIVDETSTHPFNTGTWDDSVPSNNGLSQYVDGTAEETIMLGYLRGAFDAAQQLGLDPPVGISAQDITDMQNGINDWVTNGLGEVPLS